VVNPVVEHVVEHVVDLVVGLVVDLVVGLVVDLVVDLVVNLVVDLVVNLDRIFEEDLVRSADHLALDPGGVVVDADVAGHLVAACVQGWEEFVGHLTADLIFAIEFRLEVDPGDLVLFLRDDRH
jgi:predicted cobalt transporter CbtA